MNFTTAFNATALCLLLSISVSALSIQDEFNGSVIDETEWEIFKPFGHSSVTVSDGSLRLAGRGGLNTLEGYTDSVEIIGRFRFTGSFEVDHLKFSLRSNVQTDGTGSHEKTDGILIKFDQELQKITIGETATGSRGDEVPASFPAGQDIDFRIIDHGESLQIFLNNSLLPVLEFSSSIRAGERIGIFNREFASTVTEIDFLQIGSPAVVNAPELGATFVPMAVAMLCFVSVNKRQRPPLLKSQRQNPATLTIPIVLLTLVLTGCKTVQVVSEGQNSLRATAVQVRKTDAVGTVTQFPVGLYHPEFQTEEGIYYGSERKLVTKGLGMTTVVRGGVFIPFANQKDQRHGLWMDRQESSGGLVGFALSSPKRVWRFDEPLLFESVSSDAK